MARLSSRSNAAARKLATASYIGAGVATPITGVGVLTLTTKAGAPLTTKSGDFITRKAA